VIYAEIIRVSKVNSADIQNLPGLESVLGQPQQTFDGQDSYPTLAAKAGALLYSLCMNHPFTDGNKRAALMTARVFLRLNGFDLAVETFEAVGFMTSVARGELSSDKAGQWVGQWMQPFDPRSI